MALTAGDDTLDAQIFNKSADGTRGIPEAIFIEDVESLCTDRASHDVVARLQELFSKYQYMLSSMVAQRASLRGKLPDIANALETVNHLIERRDKAEEGETAEYTYQLAENIWAKATAPASKTVCLWLGANVMLEYSLEEAVELLKTNETNAKTMLKSIDEDMAFLRDQITTTEVNIARCHNYGVKKKQKEQDEEKTGRQAKAAEGGAGGPERTAAAIRSAAGAAESSGRGDLAQGADSGPPHTWKQDKEEVEISVRLPPGAEKADLKVTILADMLKVEHAGKVLVAGQLAAKCSPNGSTWTMGKGRVEISLEKADAEQWPSLFEDVEV